MERPLAGLKVVELARVLAGPWAGQTLSDLGAEVIKVEMPGRGDPRRAIPPYATDEEGRRVAGGFVGAMLGIHARSESP